MREAKLTTGLLIIAALVLLPACGKKSVDDAEDGAAPSSTTESPGRFDGGGSTPPTSPPSSGGGGTGSTGGQSPLSFEIDEVGGSAIFRAEGIVTDNVLRVRYEVGPAGNQFFDGTDVRVEIKVNGTTRIPRYSSDPNCPSGGCEYGRPSDGASDILDFSSSVTAGVPVTIQVSQARYNWYCYSGTYPGFYDPYNGCNYRLVQNPVPSIGFNGHYWKGRLIVQTHETNEAQFEAL